MADYTKNTNFTAKDALTPGDPEKIILGADFDSEFDEIALRSADKEDTSNKAAASGYASLDSSTLVPPAQLPAATTTAVGVFETSTLSEAEALSVNNKYITPKTLNDVLVDNAGILKDLQAIADPGGDRIIFWDDSDNAAEFLTIGAGLTLTTNDLAVDQSSATVQGKVELATNTEVNTGTDTARAVTPAGLAQATSLLQATASQKGAVELASNTEVNTGTDTARVVTPAGLAQATSLLQATATQRGAAEIAIQAEVDAGTDTTRYVTPATLAAATTTGVSVELLKTADETINSDLVFSADSALNGLVIPTGSAFYFVEGVLTMISPLTADFKWKFVWTEAPTEVSIASRYYNITSGHNVDGLNLFGQSIRHDSTNIVGPILYSGVFKAGATPGTLSIHWAQETSDAGDTTVKAGSFLKITKLG